MVRVKGGELMPHRHYTYTLTYAYKQTATDAWHTATEEIKADAAQTAWLRLGVILADREYFDVVARGNTWEATEINEEAS